LIIEVDGGIHNQIGKMLKDEFRDDLFLKYGLMVSHVTNENVFEVSNRIAYGISSGEIKSIDSRAKKRLMRKLYIESLIKLSNLKIIKRWIQ